MVSLKRTSLLIGWIKMMGEVTLVDFGHYFKGGILLVNPSIDVDVFS